MAKADQPPGKTVITPEPSFLMKEKTDQGAGRNPGYHPDPAPVEAVIRQPLHRAGS